MRLPHHVVLALDVGTSSPAAPGLRRGGARASRARTARSLRAAHHSATAAPSSDPEALCAAAVTRRSTAASRRCGADAGGCAVGASVFWHSLLALDARAAAAHPVITWADTRSAPAAPRSARGTTSAAIHARTGAPLHSAFFPAKLRWLRERRPEVFARAAVWCGFGEYLLARLTGRLAASLSMASGTGLLDQIAGGVGRRHAGGVPGSPPAQLPPIDDTAAPGLIAPHAARWPALARVPWHPGARRRRVLERGLRLLRARGRVALNVGTSAALRLVLPEPLGPHGHAVGALALPGGRPARAGRRRDVGGRQRARLVPPARWPCPAIPRPSRRRSARPSRTGTASPRCPSWPASGARAGGRRHGPP